MSEQIFMPSLSVNEPIIWFSELTDDHDKCLIVLDSLRKRLDSVWPSAEYLFQNHKTGEGLEWLVEETINSWKGLAQDIGDIEQVGFDKLYAQARDRILTGVEKIINQERDIRGLGPSGSIDLPTPSLAVKEDGQRSLLSLEELDALEKAKEFLDKEWGVPIRTIATDEALKKIEKRRPIDVKPKS